MKIGVFDPFVGDTLPEPMRILPLNGDEPEFDSIGSWLDDLAGEKLPWFLASVNRAAQAGLSTGCASTGRMMP